MGDDDSDIEREIRERRKFSLAEAIGRAAGPGAMKGESPVTRMQQAEAAIENHLEGHLPGAAGPMSVVLLRHIKGSEPLLANLDQPLVVLGTFLRQVLDSEYVLQELVRELDVEWGRSYGERPHFETEGRPPHQDDPYTIASVRSTLSRLLDTLAAVTPSSSG
jgi:hypothetical protein